MTRNMPAILVAILLIVIILFMMCAFQVSFTETAVVTRFDEIKKVIEPGDAGLHFKLPWPVDRVHRYDTRLRTFDTEFRQLGTEDQKTVVMTAYATWRIDDGEKFLKTVGREDAAGRKIQDLLENRVSTVLRTHPLSHLVNVDEKEMMFAQIEEEFLSGIKQAAEDNYGIAIVSVGIQRLGIPESVTREVFTRMKEDRQKTIKELTADGQSKAQAIRSDANEISQKILARADAYAKKIEGLGQAEAAKYYPVFAKERALSDFLKQKETLKKVFQGGQLTIVLDAAQFAPFSLIRDAAISFKKASEPSGANQIGGDVDNALEEKVGAASDVSEKRPGN